MTLKPGDILVFDHITGRVYVTSLKVWKPLP